MLSAICLLIAGLVMYKIGKRMLRPTHPAIDIEEFKKFTEQTAKTISAQEQALSSFAKLTNEQQKIIDLQTALLAKQSQGISASTSRQTLSELDGLILQDALTREQRSKAALIVVLKKQGCNQQEIESLLSVIDNSEDGDIRQ